MDSSQLFYQGEQQITKKLVYGTSFYEEESMQILFKATFRGGGQYDEENGNKNGKWIEIIEPLKIVLNKLIMVNIKSKCDINYKGENMQGIQITKYIVRCGGSYDERQGVKTGKWIDKSDRFQRESNYLHW
ncbi:unnamed protein product (macronuclear) [Paramecium tetraurelia]|uniref:Uncharacterized protein n=1 Tax=Paramecium tetraurelia TaxID=5888 RepID=A0DDX8_PARTE|nr:uncharacterized protein GSPATT00016086001 [Paramecium tetraurelia]CAK81245.1 unnamed protein product [Paramecium tetraurelia]|eukprot:XP_001448642.1 hypothetical protein (macronuclear) [Paramecium tetraurelia strain d4-2]